jgi:hypothetical protein
MRHWDEFFGGPTQTTSERVHLTINSRGNILLNAKAFEKMGEPEAAVLLFDRRNSVIGLRAAPAGTAHAFPLVKKANMRHRTIHAITFCRHHKIRVDRTTSFPHAEFDADGRTLLLDFQTAIEIGRIPA